MGLCCLIVKVYKLFIPCLGKRKYCAFEWAVPGSCGDQEYGQRYCVTVYRCRLTEMGV